MAKLSADQAKHVARIGSLVREARQALGISQAAFAEKLGMDLKNFAKIERGTENVTVQTLLRIAEALGAELVVQFVFPSPRRTKFTSKAKRKGGE